MVSTKLKPTDNAPYLMTMHRCLDSTLLILARNLLLPVIFLFIIHIMIGNDAILIVIPLSELVTFFISIYLLYKHSPKNLINNAGGLEIIPA
ncbi:MAG: hypothetical protein KKD73_08635 [Proteobacteria bacterium]|nr:hypothetical protein [Pseudomonadota bacterium]MBU1710618.1 hypothetical protein [Pseudomonadota bacterium]